MSGPLGASEWKAFSHKGDGSIYIYKGPSEKERGERGRRETSQEANALAQEGDDGDLGEKGFRALEKSSGTRTDRIC